MVRVPTQKGGGSTTQCAFLKSNESLGEKDSTSGWVFMQMRSRKKVNSSTHGKRELTYSNGH